MKINYIFSGLIISDKVAYEHGFMSRGIPPNQKWFFQKLSTAKEVNLSIYEMFFLHSGAKRVYILSQLVYTVGSIFLALTRHPVTVILLSPTAGIMYATLFTMPYVLVAHYHSSNTVSPILNILNWQCYILLQERLKLEKKLNWTGIFDVTNIFFFYFLF